MSQGSRGVVGRLGLVSLLGAGLLLAVVERSGAHGDLETRLARATQEIARAPESVVPLLRRAQLHRRSGNLAAARADLDRAARLTPASREVAYQRALLLLDAGASGEALVVLDGLLGSEPDDVAAHVARARSLRALDRPIEAARAYTHAIDRAQNPLPDFYLERVDAELAGGPSRLEDAIAGLEAGIEALGPLPALTRAAVDLEQRANRLDAALARVELEIARSPQPVWWLERKGEILEAAGRRDEARVAYAEAWRRLLAQPAHRRGSPAWRQLEHRLAQRSRQRADSAEEGHGLAR